MTDHAKGKCNPKVDDDWSQDSDTQMMLANLVKTDLKMTSSHSDVKATADGRTTTTNCSSSAALMDENSNKSTSIAAEAKTKGAKNEEKKIFVGGISWDTSEEDLKSFFNQYGDVTHVQIKFDHFTGRSRGFAFVEFATAEACRKSLLSKEIEIKGKKVEIKPAKSRENKKIFVGGLPGDYSEEDLRRHFDQFGKIEEIEWPFDKFQNRRKNFAFIVFEDEEATQKASAQPKQKFGDRLCDVKIAVPQYMRPQRQFGIPTGYGTGWNEFGGYGTYGAYSGGYGSGYYDDYYATYDYSNATSAASYDYSGWPGSNTGYDGWGYAGLPTAAGGGGGGGNTSRASRSGYSNYGGAY